MALLRLPFRVEAQATVFLGRGLYPEANPMRFQTTEALIRYIIFLQVPIHLPYQITVGGVQQHKR